MREPSKEEIEAALRDEMSYWAAKALELKQQGKRADYILCDYLAFHTEHFIHLLNGRPDCFSDEVKEAKLNKEI